MISAILKNITGNATEKDIEFNQAKLNNLSGSPNLLAKTKFARIKEQKSLRI